MWWLIFQFWFSKVHRGQGWACVLTSYTIFTSLSTYIDTHIVTTYVIQYALMYVQTLCNKVYPRNFGYHWSRFSSWSVTLSEGWFDQTVWSSRILDFCLNNKAKYACLLWPSSTLTVHQLPLRLRSWIMRHRVYKGQVAIGPIRTCCMAPLHPYVYSVANWGPLHTLGKGW